MLNYLHIGQFTNQIKDLNKEDLSVIYPDHVNKLQSQMKIYSPWWWYLWPALLNQQEEPQRNWELLEHVYNKL
jgi:hypothetical protein